MGLTKIPNVIGLVLENIVAQQSMANYSFIQPMILAVLFFIGVIRKEDCTKLNIIGGYNMYRRSAGIPAHRKYYTDIKQVIE